MESPCFVAITASALPGRLSTRRWKVPMGICTRSVNRAFVRSSTDVGRQEGLAQNQRSGSRGSMGLRSGDLCGSLEFLHTKLFMTLGHGHDGTGKGFSPNCSTKLEAYNVSCSANITLHWNSGAQTAPDHYPSSSTLPVASILLTSTKPRVIHQTARQ